MSHSKCVLCKSESSACNETRSAKTKKVERRSVLASSWSSIVSMVRESLLRESMVRALW